MKRNLTRAMAMGMAFAMLGTATAFAEEIRKHPLTGTADAGEAPAAEAPVEDKVVGENYLTQSGKVSSVEAEDENGMRIVTIDNEQGGLRFVVSSVTPILDREKNGYILADDLKEGMEVAVVYDANGPMGMSLPPYLGSVTAVVANADKGFYRAGHFDDELTNTGNSGDSMPLQLNISEETPILNTMGTRERMTAEDIKGQDALVFYDATTRSIPAQTTPSLVLVLAGTHGEEVAGGTGADETVPENKGVEPAIVPLRKTAEDMGWKVTWQGKDKPVLVEKGDISVEISIGKDTYVVDGDMVKQAHAKAEMRDGVMFVSNEVFAE